MKTILSLLLISSSLLLADECYFFKIDGKPKPSSMAIKGDHLNMAMKIKKIDSFKAHSIIAFHQGLGEGRTFKIQINMTDGPAKGVYPMLKIGADIVIERIHVSGAGNTGARPTISVESDDSEQINKWVELLRLHFKIPKDKVTIHLEPEPEKQAEQVVAPDGE